MGNTWTMGATPAIFPRNETDKALDFAESLAKERKKLTKKKINTKVLDLERMEVIAKF